MESSRSALVGWYFIFMDACPKCITQNIRIESCKDNTLHSIYTRILELSLESPVSFFVTLLGIMNNAIAES